MSEDGGPVWDAVQHVVDAEDPQGLLKIGCPPDEYSSEIRDLTGLVLSGPVTADAVQAIWDHWFGPASSLTRRPERLERLVGGLVEVRRRFVTD